MSSSLLRDIQTQSCAMINANVYTQHSTHFKLISNYKRGYHQLSSQQFGVDMNINYMVIFFINLLLQKYTLFEKLRIVLFQA